MKVSDIMTSSVKTVSPGDSVSKTIFLMEKHNVKEVPVVDGRKLMGVIDFHTIIKNVKASPEMKVRGKMLKYPTVGPNADVDECIRLMVESGIEFLPVLEKDRLIGVVSDYDILKWQKVQGTVSDVVRSKVPVCSPNDTLGTARRMMRSAGVDRLAVVGNGLCVGMVLLIDILRKTHIEHKRGGDLDIGGEVKKVMSFPVAGVMRELTDKVYPDTELSHALEMMLAHNLRGVPVLNMDDRSTGILLRKDVLSLLIPPSEKGIVVRVSGRGRFDRDEVIRVVESRLRKSYYYRGFKEIKVHVKEVHGSKGSKGRCEISIHFVGDRPLFMEQDGFSVSETINDLLDDAERVMEE
ncbi:MAG: CBS domain-containing protein [Candidatus Aenigmarchaeota archaeon]|nr:CBS domain-containing protein [Candidatus Aenigmarchaeota archaeon]